MSEERFINKVEGHITSLKNLDNKALKILVSKLEQENRKLKDSNTILKKGGQVVFTLEKRIDELLEENKKLKENYAKLDKVASENVRTLDELEAKRIELEEENKKLKEDLEHRDSFFSIMRDVLANEEISNEELASILYCVVHFECGDLEMSKKEVDIAEKFWYRDYV